MNKEDRKKWKRLKSLELGYPCDHCGIHGNRTNFIGKGWHWKRVGYGKVVKICGCCSGNIGLAIPFMTEFFSNRN